ALTLPVPWPYVGREHTLTQPERLGSHLQQLVLANPLERLLEREAMRGQQMDAFLGRRRAHIGELLLLHHVAVDVLLARVLTDHHALVDALAGLDEHLAAILDVL